MHVIVLLGLVAASVGSDMCYLPIDAGTCYAYIPSYGYNTTTGVCEEFIYGGCDGNDNRFETKDNCSNTCEHKKGCDKCSLPIVTGPCDGSFPSYGYNTSTGVCESFIYGGCHGNDNRFETKENCSNTCEHKKVSSDKCALPIVTGPCTVYMRSYGYNTTIGACEEFIYGGCDGNDNRFETKENCSNTCELTKVSGDKCRLPIVTGPCDVYLTSYGYNTSSGVCEEFTYGGCGGNDNRFDTKENCSTTCGVTKVGTNMCALPIVPGTCDAYIPSYGYNNSTGVCEEFIYGGCDGNDNRFETRENCSKTCESVMCPMCALDCPEGQTPEIVNDCKSCTNCVPVVCPTCALDCPKHQKPAIINGCSSCTECVPAECSPIGKTCMIHCRGGYLKGEDGCHMCVCRKDQS